MGNEVHDGKANELVEVPSGGYQWHSSWWM